MGCICSRNNFSIKALKEKDKGNFNINSHTFQKSAPNLNIKIKYKEPKKIKKKLSEYDIINRSIINSESDFSKIDKINNNLINDGTNVLNSFDILNEKNDENKDKTFKKRNFKTNILLRIPRQPIRKLSEKINETKINSSLKLLKDIAFEPFHNGFESLNKKINHNIIFNIYPSFHEKMFEIWIEKDIQIFFQFKKNSKWGIRQKGLVNYYGYKEKFNGFNLCCILMRVGKEKKYNEIKDKKPFISKYEGPLFIKMNIDKKEIINNNYYLDGELECEIFNAKKYSKYQILRKLQFNCDIIYNCFELLNLINLFRNSPKKFIEIFFAIEKMDNLQYIQLNNHLKNNKILKKISEEENISNNKLIQNNRNIFEKIKNYLKDDKTKLNIKLLNVQIITDNEDPINIIKSLIKEDKYTFIFDSEFKYIGISIKQFENRNNIDNIKCYFLISNILI